MYWSIEPEQNKSFYKYFTVKTWSLTRITFIKVLVNLQKPTRSFEAMSDASRPADAVDERTVHVAPEVVRPVLALLVDKPEATSNYLLHKCHPCPAQVVLIHHLYPHELLKGELCVLVYLQWKFYIDLMKSNFLNIFGD